MEEGSLGARCLMAPALVVADAGAAFRAVRQAQGLTARRAATAWGVSAGRISQMESPEANLYMSTVGTAALQMGYRARLVLEPIGEGRTIVTTLPAHDLGPQ